MRLNLVVLAALLANYVPLTDARKTPYGICQARCSRLAMQCYEANGATWGQTPAKSAPATVLACNSVLAICYTGCRMTSGRI
jgi:glutamate racemase